MFECAVRLVSKNNNSKNMQCPTVKAAVELIFNYINLIIIQFNLQRPTAKELLRSPFIRRAKKNAILVECIERAAEYR